MLLRSYLLLQDHKPIKHLLGTWRAAWDVDVDGDDAVSPWTVAWLS